MCVCVVCVHASVFMHTCVVTPRIFVMFEKAKGEAKWEVRETKNRWFQEKAAVEEGQFVDKQVKYAVWQKRLGAIKSCNYI